MHEYLYREDLVRVAVILGIIVSTLIYERMQLTTGGAIVPGYLALFVLAPLSIVVTLATAYLTYRIVNGPIARRYIIYGRRKFELEVIIGLAIVTALYGVAQLQLGFQPLVTAVYGIGFVIPGLIAHDMFRQGPTRTVAVLVGALAIVAVMIFVLVSLSEIGPAATVPSVLPSPVMRGFSDELLLPAVIVSVLAGMVLFHRLGLRSGGFVTAAYLAAVALDPRDLLFTAVIAGTTYLIVARVMGARLMLFGRRKVAMMMLVATSLAWAAESGVIFVSGGQYHPWQGFSAIALMIPGLLANDAERQGPERTVWGATLATLTVLVAMNLLTTALDLLPPAVTALVKNYP